MKNEKIIAAAIIGAAIVIATAIHSISMRSGGRYEFIRPTDRMSVSCIFDKSTGARYFPNDGEWVELNPVKGTRRRFTIP